MQCKTNKEFIGIIKYVVSDSIRALRAKGNKNRPILFDTPPPTLNNPSGHNTAKNSDLPDYHTNQCMLQQGKNGFDPLAIFPPESSQHKTHNKAKGKTLALQSQEKQER